MSSAQPFLEDSPKQCVPGQKVWPLQRVRATGWGVCVCGGENPFPSFPTGRGRGHPLGSLPCGSEPRSPGAQDVGWRPTREIWLPQGGQDGRAAAAMLRVHVVLPSEAGWRFLLSKGRREQTAARAVGIRGATLPSRGTRLPSRQYGGCHLGNWRVGKGRSGTPAIKGSDEHWAQGRGLEGLPGRSLQLWRPGRSQEEGAPVAAGDCASATASARAGSPRRRSAIVAGGCRSLGSPRIRSPGAAPCVRDPGCSSPEGSHESQGCGPGGRAALSGFGRGRVLSGGRAGVAGSGPQPGPCHRRPQGANRKPNPETTNRHPTSRPSRATPPPKPPPTPYILGAWWLRGSGQWIRGVGLEGIRESQLGSECVSVCVCVWGGSGRSAGIRASPMGSPLVVEFGWVSLSRQEGNRSPWGREPACRPSSPPPCRNAHAGPRGDRAAGDAWRVPAHLLRFHRGSASGTRGDSRPVPLPPAGLCHSTQVRDC